MASLNYSLWMLNKSAELDYVVVPWHPTSLGNDVSNELKKGRPHLPGKRPSGWTWAILRTKPWEWRTYLWNPKRTICYKWADRFMYTEDLRQLHNLLPIFLKHDYGWSWDVPGVAYFGSIFWVQVHSLLIYTTRFRAFDPICTAESSICAIMFPLVVG